MKVYGILAFLGFAVLVSAAVWMGALNQDEGWYLYAAQLVSEGKLLYHDFFFTQGPGMPVVYSAFARVWQVGGLFGARVLTAAIGTLSILLGVVLVRRLVPDVRRGLAGVTLFLLLGCNLYHLYYVSIPKTYALAGLWTMAGFLFLHCALAAGSARRRVAPAVFALSGAAFGFAAATRLSLGLLPAVVGFGLIFGFRRRRWSFLWFGLGGAVVLALTYGFFLLVPQVRSGFLAAQAYHAARGGFDPVFAVGSLSRLVRWYLPLFVVLGLGIALVFGRRRTGEEASAAPTDGRELLTLMVAGVVSVFLLQMMAPFPYEDYQVPLMGSVAVIATALFAGRTASPLAPLLVLGLAWGCSFGSPLLEEWSTNGKDRFWSLKKEKSELAQLREMAATIEALDPGGKELLTQDTYLAIETGRHVPKGLEMGPFSILSDAEWRRLLSSAPCRVAALSGYSFAVNPPVCDERPIGQQVEYFEILKRSYDCVLKEEHFGQNHTTLLVLERTRDRK